MKIDLNLKLLGFVLGCFIGGASLFSFGMQQNLPASIQQLLGYEFYADHLFRFGLKLAFILFVARLMLYFIELVSPDAWRRVVELHRYSRYFLIAIAFIFFTMFISMFLFNGVVTLALMFVSVCSLIIFVSGVEFLKFVPEQADSSKYNMELVWPPVWPPHLPRLFVALALVLGFGSYQLGYSVTEYDDKRNAMIVFSSDEQYEVNIIGSSESGIVIRGLDSCRKCLEFVPFSDNFRVVALKD